MKTKKNKSNSEGNLIGDDGYDPELEIIEYELIFSIAKEEEKLLACLKDDFNRKIDKFKPLAIQNNWILPDIDIFGNYLADLEKKLQLKYKDDPEILTQKYSERAKRYQIHVQNRVTKELYPIVYELYKGGTIHFPKPEIPESYLLDWMEKKKKDLIKRGLISTQSKTKKTVSIPSKKGLNPQRKVFREDLKKLFFEKNNNYDEYEEILNKLFDQGLLSDSKCTWIGIEMHGKTQLASLIKWVGIDRLKVKFTEKEVTAIALKNFNTEISLGSVKKGKAENGEFYLMK